MNLSCFVLSLYEPSAQAEAYCGSPLFARRAHRCIAIVFVAASLIGAAAHAEPAPTTTPLAGPRVETAAAKLTLVDRDANGQLKRLEGDLIQIAMEKINLDPTSREKVQQLISIRHAVMDKLVYDNLNLLVELNNAKQSGDRETVRRVIMELYQQVQPTLTRERLVSDLRAALPVDGVKFAQMMDMIDEYTRAGVQDRMREQGEEQEASQRAAVIRERLQQFGEEIKRAYYRVFTFRKEEFDAMLAKLDLTPEQDATIHRLATDLVQKANGKPTHEQYTSLYMQITRELTPEQRRTLMDLQRERGNPAPKTDQPAPAKP